MSIPHSLCSAPTRGRSAVARVTHWLGALFSLQQRKPTLFAPATQPESEPESQWTGVEPIPLSPFGGEVLTEVLDRHAQSRSAFCSLALVEHALRSGKVDPLATLSPWVLRQAKQQLEAIADIRRERQLVPLYLHLRRAAHSAAPAGSAVTGSEGPCLPPAPCPVHHHLVTRFGEALSAIVASRSGEVASLLQRVRDAECVDDVGMMPWVEEQLDGFRQLVLREAVRPTEDRASTPDGSKANRQPVTEVLRWLDEVTADPQMRVAAILFYETVTTEIVPYTPLRDAQTARSESNRSLE